MQAGAPLARPVPRAKALHRLERSDLGSSGEPGERWAGQFPSETEQRRLLELKLAALLRGGHFRCDSCRPMNGAHSET